MYALYHRVSQMLVDFDPEAAGESNCQALAKDIVDMILKDIRTNGFPSIDLAAAHDGPETD